MLTSPASIDRHAVLPSPVGSTSHIAAAAKPDKLWGSPPAVASASTKCWIAYCCECEKTAYHLPGKRTGTQQRRSRKKHGDAAGTCGEIRKDSVKSSS